ncbi:uncharacterized protein CANTADRAFT_49866 [Suhomyces tanzawaensis NRRL Y-17324]|uniref:Uncharacterized protein n=1 Tax=Suhomyces tanzawaensis NRRL Y-17324 TaxID=984487 RepID=A0A1E4SJV2_9ASCO|nr:uncharacterized protein CANTADRAFT_49866 [Suhomyces tanzawaensis NRRL Y-17324]ODV79783.1 hypothetical protein CANTADRAFT_49866 [Suhomyces tanzawaensis NRRL Y-17324]
MVSWRPLSTQTHPPTHFSDPHSVPRPYGETQPPQDYSYTAPMAAPLTAQNNTANGSESKHQQSDRGSNIKEITSLIAMYVLAYIAIDNYTTRTKLESLNKETSAITQKALQVQQANFLNARKQRDLQIVQERRDHARRSFKMSVHIAMLRKQLVDLGVDPLEIDEAVKEFERSVKVDNSMKNVSGQTLWIDDSSRTYMFQPSQFRHHTNP